MHEGKIALVTGAGSGVGQAIAVALAGVGLTVGLVGRRRDKLEATAAQIATNGGNASLFAADVTDPDAMVAVVAALGTVSVLVNNAGVHNGCAPISESDPLRWRETLQINVYAPYLLSRLCAPGMRAAGWGRVIQISSAAGFAPPSSPGADYILSKYALNFFTRQLAAEWEGTELSCCALHPGEVQSEMWEDIQAAGGMEGWVELVARTGGDPPEKAAARVLQIVAAPAAQTNGQFLWIEDGLQKPRPTW